MKISNIIGLILLILGIIFSLNAMLNVAQDFIIWYIIGIACIFLGHMLFWYERPSERQDIMGKEVLTFLLWSLIFIILGIITGFETYAWSIFAIIWFLGGALFMLSYYWIKIRKIKSGVT